MHNDNDSVLLFKHFYQISKIKLILCCALTCLCYIVSLLMYIKSVVVECNESRFCRLLIPLLRLCWTAEQIRLLDLRYTGMFEHYLDILYFFEKINCPIDAA